MNAILALHMMMACNNGSLTVDKVENKIATIKVLGGGSFRVDATSAMKPGAKVDDQWTRQSCMEGVEEQYLQTHARKSKSAK